MLQLGRYDPVAVTRLDLEPFVALERHFLRFAVQQIPYRTGQRLAVGIHETVDHSPYSLGLGLSDPHHIKLLEFAPRSKEAQVVE